MDDTAANGAAAEKVDRRRRPQRKVEILQAVMALLEVGDGKLTTAALARHMKISEAALYRHFPGKAAMFLALADYIEDHLLQPINQLMSKPGSTVTNLERLLSYHLRFLKDHPGLCRVFLVEGVAKEAPGIDERMGGITRKYVAQIKQIIRRGQAGGEIPPELPVEAAAQLFVGLVQSRALAYVQSGFKHEPDTDLLDLISLLRRAYLAPF